MLALVRPTALQVSVAASGARAPPPAPPAPPASKASSSKVDFALKIRQQRKVLAGDRRAVPRRPATPPSPSIQGKGTRSRASTAVKASVERRWDGATAASYAPHTKDWQPSVASASSRPLPDGFASPPGVRSSVGQVLSGRPALGQAAMIPVLGAAPLPPLPVGSPTSKAAATAEPVRAIYARPEAAEIPLEWQAVPETVRVLQPEPVVRWPRSKAVESEAASSTTVASPVTVASAATNEAATQPEAASPSATVAPSAAAMPSTGVATVWTTPAARAALAPVAAPRPTGAREQQEPAQRSDPVDLFDDEDPDDWAHLSRTQRQLLQSEGLLPYGKGDYLQ